MMKGLIEIEAVEAAARLGAAVMLEKCANGKWQDVAEPETLVEQVVAEVLKTLNPKPVEVSR